MNKSLIQQAIQNKQVLEIWYEPGKRLIEPYCLGYGSNGQILLRGFQAEGASQSHEPIDWKLFRFDRIKEIRCTEQNCNEIREGYNPNDSVMKGGIIARR